MPEIAEAQALLAALAETEEVKAAEAQRQRRLHLQTAYGQAMMWSKGFAAEETKAAFARAAELAETTNDFSERFAALHGQWAAAITGGELRSARELASDALARSGGRGTGHGSRHRQLEARPGRFLSRRFCRGADPLRAGARRSRPEPRPKAANVSATSALDAFVILAATMWQLGEVERARELIDWANRRASEARSYRGDGPCALLEIVSGILARRPLATLSAAEALERLAREHGMLQYVNEAELHSGWARGRIDDPTAGAAQVDGSGGLRRSGRQGQSWVLHRLACGARGGNTWRGQRARSHRRSFRPLGSGRTSLLALPSFIGCAAKSC